VFVYDVESCSFARKSGMLQAKAAWIIQVSMHKGNLGESDASITSTYRLP
jgi:hypothetical protein